MGGILLRFVSLVPLFSLLSFFIVHLSLFFLIVSAEGCLYFSSWKAGWFLSDTVFLLSTLKHKQIEGDVLDFLKFYFAILEIQKLIRRISTIELGAVKARSIHCLSPQKIGFHVYCDNLS